MTTLSDFELIERLLLAALLGGLIGLEREWKNKDAGLRTNILITIGSALFTLMSIELPDGRGDPGRTAAQIVTGIGFLGAGAIMRTDAGIQGLTTAATIWVNAAVVMPCTALPLRRIAPPPRKPIPVTICAAIRSAVPASCPISDERIVKSADPSAIRMLVRSPAGF